MHTGQFEDQAPTVLGSYRRAWETLKATPGRLILIAVLYGILQSPMNLVEGTLAQTLAGLYQILVSGPLTFGMSYVFLVAVRGRDPEVGDLFSPFQSRYVAALIASFILPFIIIIAAIPGFAVLAIAGLGDPPSPIGLAAATLLMLLPLFALVRLSFVPYLLIEEQMGPIEVLGESWERTQPVWIQIVGIELLAIPLMALGLLLFIVGIVPAIILVGLALAALYEHLTPEPEESEEEIPAPTAA